MIDIGYNGGDIAVSKNGDIALCNDEDTDVVQTINNLIRLRFGSNKYHTYLGNGIYNHRLKAAPSGIAIIQEECRIAALQDPRVNDIEINVTLGKFGEAIVDYVADYTPMDLDEYEDEDDYFNEDEDPDTDSDVDIDTLDDEQETDDEYIDEDDATENENERSVNSRISIDVFNIGGSI